MMSNIIDGRKINNEIGEALKQKIFETGVKISLGILCVGDDRASHSFINVKKRFGEKYGFTVNLFEHSENISKEEIIEKLKQIQNENDAIIVQLPLPEKFKNDTNEILGSLDVRKDVDNLTEKNFFTSPIILALQKVMPAKIGKLAIVGLGKVVGQPTKEYCKNKGILTEEIGEKDFEKIKECDVVVSGVGIPKLITKQFIKNGSVLIDYGCSYLGDKLYGDFDEGCYERASSYTPVPGGMGPIVVACLFENVLLTKLK